MAESKSEIIKNPKINRLYYPKLASAKREFYGSSRLAILKEAYNIITDDSIHGDSYDTKVGRSILIHLIVNGLFSLIRPFLVRKNPDLALKDQKRKATPLHWAAYTGNCLVVRELLNVMKDQDQLHLINEPDKEGNTPLMIAVREGYLDVIQMLWKAGADLDIRNNHGQTVFDIAQQAPIIEFLNTHQTLTPEELKSARESKEDNQKELEETERMSQELMAAVKDHDESFFSGLQRAKEIIASAGTFSKDSKKHQAMLEAATQTVETYKRYVHYVDNQDKTAWVSAVQEGNINAMLLLIELGADINRQNEQGFTVLHRQAKHGDPDIINALFSSAIQSKLTTVGKKLDLEKRDQDGNTPLALAAKHGHADAVSALLAAGASYNSPNNSGETPLVLARKLEDEQTREKVVARFFNFLPDHEKFVKYLDYDLLQPVIQGAQAFRQEAASGLMEFVRNKQLAPALASEPEKELDLVNFHSKFIKKITAQKPAELIKAYFDEEEAAPLRLEEENAKKLLTLISIDLNKNPRRSEKYGAVRHQKMEGTQALMEQKIDYRFTGQFKGNILIYLILNDFVSLISQVLDICPELIALQDSRKDNALHWAAYKGNPEVVRMLLMKLKEMGQLGVIINQQGCNDNTPLMMAIDVEGYSEGGNFYAARLLIAEGADFRIHKNRWGSSAYSLAERYSRDNILPFMTAFEEAGKEKSASPDAKNSGLSPKQRALTLDLFIDTIPPEDESLFNETQRQEFAQRVREKKSQTLINAVKDGNKEEVARLLPLGFDVHYRDCNGLNLLHHAVLGGDEKLVARLLREPGININARIFDVGDTALGIAVRYDYPLIVKVLLEAGAGFTIKHFSWYRDPLDGANSKWKRAESLLEQAEAEVLDRLHQAAKKNDPSTIKQLLKQHRADLHKGDADGNTVLHHAASGGYARLVTLLLKHGARRSQTNNQKQTPEMLGEKHPAVLEAFRHFQKLNNALSRSRRYAERLLDPKSEDLHDGYLARVLKNLEKEDKNDAIHMLIEDLTDDPPKDSKETMARLKGFSQAFNEQDANAYAFSDAFKEIDKVAADIVLKVVESSKSGTSIALPKLSGWQSFLNVVSGSSNSQVTVTPVQPPKPTSVGPQMSSSIGNKDL